MRTEDLLGKSPDYASRVEQEWEKIQATEFWKIYYTRIQKERKQASEHCEKDEDVKGYQGAIRAFDIILELPKKIKETLLKG